MTKRTDRPATSRSNRTKRVPISGQRDIMTVQDKDPNFHYCWVNDEGTRIQDYLAADYEIVQDPAVTIGDAQDVQVGDALTVTVDRVTGMKAILMRQPLEFYEEDRATEQVSITRSEESLFRQQNEEKGRYGTIRKE